MSWRHANLNHERTISPMYHSLRRESIKNTNSEAIGVKSVRPTWFEDIVTSREPASQAGQEQPEPMHGLKLVIKEFFPSNAFMALARSLLTSNRSKKMNCKLSCKAVRMTIASKEHW